MARISECRITKDECNRPSCSRSLCELEEAQKHERKLAKEERELDEASALAREIEQVAKDWAPRVIKGVKVSASNKGELVRKTNLMAHPKVIAEAKKRRAEIRKMTEGFSLDDLLAPPPKNTR